MSVALWARRNLAKVIAAAVLVLGAAATVLWFYAARQTAEAAALALLHEITKEAELARDKPEGQAEAVQKVIERCALLVKEHPDSPAVPPALLDVAQLLAGTGRGQEAVPYFRRVIESAGSESPLASLARRGIAEALEEAKQTREAIAEYRVLLQGQEGLARAQTSWDLGRCYQALGETDLAVDFYREAVKDGGPTDWAQLAQFRLLELLARSQAKKKIALNEPGNQSSAPQKEPSKAPAKDGDKAPARTPDGKASPTSAKKQAGEG